MGSVVRTPQIRKSTFWSAAIAGLWVVACFAPAPAFAEEGTGDRRMAALAPPSDGTIERLMQLAPPEDRDWIYETYFSKHDRRVGRQYEDSWRYHELQARYAPGGQIREFQQAGTIVAPGTTVYEADVRQGMAQFVLRSRVEAAIYSALAKISDVKNSAEKLIEVRKKVSAKLLNAANVPLSKSADPFRFQLGYDLFSDISRIELSNSRWGFGLYHTRFVGALTGGAGIPLEALRLQASTQVVKEFASIAFAFMPMAHLVETSLSRPLTRTSTVTLSTQQPMNVDAYARYNLSVGIQF